MVGIFYPSEDRRGEGIRGFHDIGGADGGGSSIRSRNANRLGNLAGVGDEVIGCEST